MRSSTQISDRWKEVYIHSKRMIINDTYMMLRSANINTRSMEVDTELNIAHCRAAITMKARQDLWNQHTGGLGKHDDEDKAYKAWKKIIGDNKELKEGKERPKASLCEFLRTSTKRTNKD